MKLQDIKSKKSFSEQYKPGMTLDVHTPDTIKNALVFLNKKIIDVQARMARLEPERDQNNGNWQYPSSAEAYQQAVDNLQDLQSKVKKLKSLSKTVVTDIDIDHLWNRIKTECSEYLEACSRAQTWLFRGLGYRENRPAFLEKSQEQRIPVDSNPMLMKSFDQSLQHLGFAALRHNSIFCSSNRDTAGAFGYIYVVFPRNGFDYTYTNEREIILDELEQVLSPKYIESWHRAVKNIAKQAPNQFPLLHVTATAHQMWFDIQKNKDILLSQGFPQNLVDNISDPAYIEQKYQPQKTQLYKALKQGDEIYVRGEYYALRWDFYRKSLAFWMNEIQKAPLSEQTAHDGNAASPTQVIATELDKWHAAAGRMQERIHTLMRQGDHVQELNTRKALQNFRDKIGTPNIEQMPLARKLLTEIQQKCSDILEICHDTGRFLYHGSKHLGEFTYLAHSQPRQRPKDSDPATSRVFNYGLEKLGFTATRDNSLFVTSDRTLASEYGELYVVLPCTGQYDFTYTSRKDDVLTKYNFHSLINHDKSQLLFTAWQKIPYDVQKEIIVWPEMLKTAQDLIHWLVEHENSLGTISKIQKLTGLSAKWQDYVDLPELRYVYNPRQDNLADAMSSEREIYLKGKFYLLKVDPWKNGIDWWPILQSWIKKT